MKGSVKKKVSHRGCTSQQEVATFAPRFNRRRCTGAETAKLFSVRFLEKGRTASYLCSPVSNEKRARETGKRRKERKTFSSPVLGKSKNGVTFAARFNRKRVTLKTKCFAKFASKKKFFRKACRKQKAAYLCNPLRSEGVTNTNTAPLASGPRLLPLRSDRRSLNDWKRQKR